MNTDDVANIADSKHKEHEGGPSQDPEDIAIESWRGGTGVVSGFVEELPGASAF
jgi:hypothetical protein